MSEQEYIIHITKEGDRWDLLAYEYYGDALKYEPIIARNPHVRPDPILSSGIRLEIPIVEGTTTLPKELLPPWKR